MLCWVVVAEQSTLTIWQYYMYYWVSSPARPGACAVSAWIARARDVVDRPVMTRLYWTSCGMEAELLASRIIIHAAIIARY